MDDTLTIAGRSFDSRLILGTGKYETFELMRAAVEASAAEMVTVAVRRIMSCAPGPRGCCSPRSRAARGSPPLRRFAVTVVPFRAAQPSFADIHAGTVQMLVIIGGVNRPDFANVRFDLGALKTLPFLLSLGKGGDRADMFGARKAEAERQRHGCFLAHPIR